MSIETAWRVFLLPCIINNYWESETLCYRMRFVSKVKQRKQNFGTKRIPCWLPQLENNLENKKGFWGNSGRPKQYTVGPMAGAWFIWHWSLVISHSLGGHLHLTSYTVLDGIQNHWSPTQNPSTSWNSEPIVSIHVLTLTHVCPYMLSTIIPVSHKGVGSSACHRIIE